MTVSSTTNKHYYNGTGSQTSFPYAFKVFAKTDLTVYVDGVLKTVDTDFTVSDVGIEAGGNIVFSVAPVIGTGNIAIIRQLALSQSVDLVQYGKFDAEVIEAQYDKLTMMVQQIQEQADRSIRFSASVSDVGDGEITDTVAERSGKVLAYDANGDLSVANELGDWQGNWTTTTIYAVRDLVMDSATNNVYTCLVGHTAGTLATDVSAGKWALVIDAVAVAASASAAAADLVLTNADVVLTNADVVLTNADVVLTHADVVLAEADKVQTGLDRAAVAADLILTNADVVSAEADKVQTGLDRTATNADVVLTNADVVLTHADVVLAEADKVQTGLDKAATNADVVLTNADVVLTNADVVLAEADKVQTALDRIATGADVTTATTKAGEASTSASNAADSLATFTGQYVSQATAPSSPSEGDLWFDTTANTMKVYDGSGFINAGSSVNGIENSVQHTATAGQTSFTATYDAGFLQVYLNGLRLDAEDYTATNGSTVVLDTGATLNDVVFIHSFGTFVLADTYTQAQADARYKSISASEGGPSLGTNSVIRTNAQTISEDITFAGTENGSSVGPITVASTYTVTVASGSTWVIL